MSRNPIDIGFGFASGFKNFQAFGISETIAAAEARVVGPNMTTISTAPTGSANRVHLLESPGTLSVTRASGSDTGRVAVLYLDSSWYERTAIFDLSGSATASVDVGGQAIMARRVNQLEYLDGGNIGEIEGKIADQMANRIGAGHGLSRSALYTTPRGQRVALTGFGIASQTTRPVVITLWFREPNKKPKVLNWWPARESLEVFALPIPRLIQSRNADDWKNVVPVTCGIDLFATAQRPVGSMDTSDVSVYMGFVAQVTVDDAAAPGFTVF